MARLARPRPVQVALMVAVLGAAPPPLRAEDSPAAVTPLDDAKAVFAEAEKAYGLGRFEEALRGFERAYELLPLPGFLFNIGQCHRNLGNWERASFFYQGYLSRQPKAANADKVQALVAQMDDKVREQQEARARAAAAPPSAPRPVGPLPVAPMAAPPGPPPPVVPAVASPGPAPPFTLAAAPAAAPTAGRSGTPLYRRWWLWTAIGVVLVGASAGIAAAAVSPSVSSADLAGTLGGPIDARR